MIPLYFFGLLFLASLLDIKAKRIPNTVVIGLFLVSLVSLLVEGVSPAGEALATWDIAMSLMVALAVTLPGYLLGQLGAGDIKLLLVLCLVFLPAQMLLLIAGSFLLLAIFGKIRKSGKMPFAPFVTIVSFILVLGG